MLNSFNQGLNTCLFSSNMMNKFHTSAVMQGQATKKKRPVRFLLKTAKYLRPKMKDYDIPPTKRSLDRKVEAMDETGSMAADPISTLLFPDKMYEAQQEGLMDAEMDEILGSDKPGSQQFRVRPGSENPFVSFVAEYASKEGGLQELQNMDWHEMKEKFSNRDMIEALMSLEDRDREDVWRRICYEIYPTLQVMTTLDLQNEEASLDVEDEEENKAEELFTQELWSVFKTKHEEFQAQVDKDLKAAGYVEIPEEEAQKLLPVDLKQELQELEQLVKGDVLSKEQIRSIRTSMEEMLEESYLTNDPVYQKAKKAADAWKANFVSHENGDKMWQLHKENPDYWTGERLGRAFGVPRNKAWAEIILREYAEAKETGKPFNPRKTEAIFAKDIAKLPFNVDGTPKTGKKKSLDSSKLDSKLTHGKTEEEVYAEFLKKSVDQKDDSDDNLPSWAKYPFQEPGNVVPTKQEQKTIQQLPMINNVSTLGSNYSRYGIMFAEMTRNKKQAPLDRQFLVKETDDTLRTMTTTEKEFMTRRGHIKRTKWGMGKKAFRTRKVRERQFDQIQS